ncbi:MAG: hypothetical protein K9M82_13695 [Deltaproteobacteria bacterium]|nr:hypothetical protein [Deltaproteobacteria bacterium]
MTTDIREKPFIGPEDLLALNFIRAAPPYAFRTHYRQGLRSHILEVLDPEALKAEQCGVAEGGVLRFPRARPFKMFRVFRTRFRNSGDGLEEIGRVKLVERYLGVEHMARSEEFLADYLLEGRRDLLLCGLQEYVEGEPLDPWSPVREGLPDELAGRLRRRGPAFGMEPVTGLAAVIRDRGASFIDRVKRMALEAACIPDLAGVSNLILTPSGVIRLVDINNISRVSFAREIPLDDKGYPICDKSVQALSLLEHKLLDRDPDPGDPLYRHFLDPVRIRKVKSVEAAFHRGTPFRASPHLQ